MMESHSASATKQIQQADVAAVDIATVNANGALHSYQPHHQNHNRRHTSAGALTFAAATSGCGAYSRTVPLSKSKSASLSATEFSDVVNESVAASSETPQKTLPDRTTFDAGHVHFDDDDSFNENGGDINTKDCVEYACALPSPLPDHPDEPDHLQHRFGGPKLSTCSSSREHMHRPYDAHNSPDACAVSSDGGCASGQSSVISSPAPSTVSSPLSTPTRLSPHLLHQLHRQHCCQQSLPDDQQQRNDAGAAGTFSSLASASQQHHHQHQHHHHHLHHAHAHLAAGSTAGCKKSQKLDPRLSPSPYRQLLPIVLCILSFATVFSILIVYMDTTEIRHQQFRLNMSRDYDLYGVAQDDPTLIAFLREIHMRKYPMHFSKNARETSSISEQRLNFSGVAHNELAPQMAHYVADLVGGRMNGAVIQSLSGSLGYLMTAQWLSETLNWAGIIVEPEPRRYFTLRKQNAQCSRMQVLHACVSPNPYPKEVTIHNEEPEVQINSLFDEETSWFNSRVKCFPLYTIMLACNRVEYDLLSLGVHGHELEILQTLPFDKIKIEVISIHLPDSRENARDYIQAITKFLATKSYKFQRKFGRNYFYQRIKKTSRTRKKDILLLKAP